MKGKWIVYFLILFLTACTTGISSKGVKPTELVLIEENSTKLEQIPSVPPKETIVETLPSTTPVPKVMVDFIKSEAFVNLRSGPGTLYPVIAQHPTNQPMEVIGISSSSEWVLLNYPDSETHQAWVYSSLISLQGINLPILDTQSMKFEDNNLPIPTQVQPSLNVLLTKFQLDPQLIQYSGQDTHINHPSLPTIENFLCQGVKYSIDPKAGLVVVIDASLAYLPLPNPDKLSLELLANQFIINLAPSVDLDELTKNHGAKGGISFYRWEKSNFSYIQVGLTENGELVTFINAVY
jgi:SH3-like domain-containing protein